MRMAELEPQQLVVYDRQPHDIHSLRRSHARRRDRARPRPRRLRQRRHEPDDAHDAAGHADSSADPTNTWSAAGQIVALGTTQGVGGATVTPGWSLAPVTADGQGNYQLGDVANPPSTPYPITVSAAGMVSHATWITWASGPRSGVNLNHDSRRGAVLDGLLPAVRPADTFDNDPGAPFGRAALDRRRPASTCSTVDQNGRAVEPEVHRR